ncbi:ABC transporter ATP-binding protein [Terrimonas pollutisoli]|uniref:ABC transporter ATP-binding protein n=1 Tax=Terrimonas pollutisoli TaxID=3034147 RepID=UPI0023ECD438|nr:ATP-binding cassette domain-containing protein [Terrimonas sp. H1YJ31]
MKIILSDVGKRFNRDWIFRHFTYTFEQGRSYAITGPNGSGKSTLLQVLSGSMHFNEGSLRYESQKSEVGSEKLEIPHEKIYQHVSICAPYLEVVEEMTLKEFLDFHHGFKPFLPDITTGSIIARLGLEKAADKQIRYYSSGMKQRVKLAQCIFSDTTLVLLDEPCTNLDVAGIELYHQLVSEYCDNRLVVVSSNDKVEYSFCKDVISISDYK